MRYFEGDVFQLDPIMGFSLNPHLLNSNVDFLYQITLRLGEKVLLWDGSDLELSHGEELVRYVVEACYWHMRRDISNGVSSSGMSLRRYCLILCQVLNGKGKEDAEFREWRQGLFERIDNALKECPVCDYFR